MFLLIGLRAFPGYQFEILVKTGEIGKAAFIAKLLDADVVVEEKLTGMANPDLGDELGIGLTGPGFEKTAEGIGNQSRYGCHLVEIDRLGKMTESVFIYCVDPVILQLREIMTETDGGKRLQMRRIRKSGKTFDKSHNAADAFCRPDLPDQRRNLRLFICADQQASFCFFKEAADLFGLGQIKKGFTPEIFRKVNDGRMNGMLTGTAEVNIVVTPVMRKIGSYENDVTGLKAFDVIPHELCAAALVKKYQLHLNMIVPSIVNEWIPVLTDAEGLGRSLWDF